MITREAFREAAELRRRGRPSAQRRYLTVDDLETMALLIELQDRIELGLPPFDNRPPATGAQRR